MSRWEWRGWKLALLAAVIAAVVAALNTAWPKAVLTSALVAAGSALTAVLFSRAKANWDRRARETSELEQYLLLDRHGRLPRVRDLENIEVFSATFS